MSSSNLVCVAEIIGSHGIKGTMKLRIFLNDTAALESYSPFVTSDGNPFPFKVLQQIPKGIFIQTPEVQDRTQADALKGTKLFIPRERLKALREEEYYYTDLIGCKIKDQTGIVYGDVKNVSNYGAGDILEVALEASKDLILLPFRKEFILEVHIENPSLKEGNYIVVDKDLLESERDQEASQEKEEKEE